MILRTIQKNHWCIIDAVIAFLTTGFGTWNRTPFQISGLTIEKGARCIDAVCAWPKPPDTLIEYRAVASPISNNAQFPEGPLAAALSLAILHDDHLVFRRSPYDPHRP